MYELKKVSKLYPKGRGTVAALKDVNLVIADGEFLSVQGPTGHGKTTLLLLLGGLDRPTSGSISFDGQDLGRLGESKLVDVRARNFGFVFQNYNLMPTLSAAENVEAALVPLSVSNTERRARSLAALSEVGLADRAAHFPEELSGGEQQRVAIARALVKEPKVVLADEPTGNLDEVTQAEIVDLMLALWKRMGMTLVVVTHDTQVAKQAPRSAIINHGALSLRNNLRGRATPAAEGQVVSGGVAD